jgi:hypothetical protein
VKKKTYENRLGAQKVRHCREKSEIPDLKSGITCKSGITEGKTGRSGITSEIPDFSAQSRTFPFLVWACFAALTDTINAEKSVARVGVESNTESGFQIV